MKREAEYDEGGGRLTGIGEDPYPRRVICVGVGGCELIAVYLSSSERVEGKNASMPRLRLWR